MACSKTFRSASRVRDNSPSRLACAAADLGFRSVPCASFCAPSDEPGPKVHLGDTTWGEPVVVPLTELVRACGVATGGMGSGKTMAACVVLEAMIARLPDAAFHGLRVPRCERRTLRPRAFLLARRVEKLEGQGGKQLLRRIVIIDFSSRKR